VAARQGLPMSPRGGPALRRDFESWWQTYGHVFAEVYKQPRQLAEAAWHACKQMAEAVAAAERAEALATRLHRAL
jgi:hypothetical protein